MSPELALASMKAKNVLLNIVAVFFGFLVCLAALEIAARILPVSRGILYSAVNDAHPIQTYEPNRDYVFERGFRFDIVNRGRINNHGFVNDADYDPKATSPLLAVVGDSFIEALMVPFKETMHGRLAAALDGRARVYSFAISGAPLSQYMMYAEYARDLFGPQGLVVNVVANDFDESVKDYVKSPGFHYFEEDAEGAFVLRRGTYEPDSMRRLVARSALARYLQPNLAVIDLPWRRKEPTNRTKRYVANTASETDVKRMRLSRKAVDQFLDELPARAGLPRDSIVLVLDGIRPALYDEGQLAEVRDSYAFFMREYLAEQAAAQGFEVLDMQPRFIARHKKDGVRFEFPTDQHWNGEGHGEAAKAVRESKMFARLFD
jgi:hypothetical protein